MGNTSGLCAGLTMLVVNCSLKESHSWLTGVGSALVALSLPGFTAKPNKIRAD